MLRAALRPSCVLHAAFLSSSSSAAVHNEAASETSMASNAISSAAASLWMQNSQSHDGAAATMHTQQTDATGAAAAQDHGNALVVLEEDSTSGSNGYVDYFMGGFGPRHLAEVTVVPESAGARAHGSHDHANKADAAAAAVEASFSSETATAAAAASPTRRAGGDDGAVARRPVITKARRIRLASAASQAAEVLQSVGSPATALLLSQRVQQLQAEEALLNASLQRLKAERDLATVRHTCDEELDNYRRGVQQREQQVVRAAITAGTRSQDPLVSYSQESGGSAGGDTLQTVVEADLLGMPATADAEAAAAAAGKAVQKSGRASHAAATVISAKKRLRYSATAAGGHKANASPKSLSRRPATPAASKSKRPSLAKQTAVKARAGKHLAAVCKHAAKDKPKAPLRMKGKAPAPAAATAKAAAQRQKAKVKAAATKPSRKLTKKPTKPRATTKAKAVRARPAAKAVRARPAAKAVRARPAAKSVRARPAAKSVPSTHKTAAKKRPRYEKRPTRR